MAKFLLFLCVASLTVAAAPTQTAPSAKRPPDEGESPNSSDALSRTRPSKLRPFLGAVRHQGNFYVLRAGDLEYKLDDSAQAKAYDGQNVKVIGTLDQQSNTLRIQTIESFPVK
jgi:uncharacterized protein involved in copper resistance